MRAFVREQDQLTLPTELQRWAQDLAMIHDSNIRQDFFVIQQELETIIYEEVVKKGRLFYGGNQPPNAAIQDRVLLQGDGRPFMTLAKGAPRGIVNAPEQSRK